MLEDEMLVYVGDLGVSGAVGEVEPEEGTSPDDIDSDTMDALRAIGYVR